MNQVSTSTIFTSNILVKIFFNLDLHEISSKFFIFNIEYLDFVKFENYDNIYYDIEKIKHNTFNIKKKRGENVWNTNILATMPKYYKNVNAFVK